jgi:hypothetical protein
LVEPGGIEPPTNDVVAAAGRIRNDDSDNAVKIGLCDSASCENGETHKEGEQSLHLVPHMVGEHHGMLSVLNGLSIIAGIVQACC